MKTIIITTKEAEECYQTISDNWFDNCTRFTVRVNSVKMDPRLQSEFNIVRVKESEDYRLCLPQCVNPLLPQEQKRDYVLSLACAIAKYFNVEKSELYLMFHSGDLFSLDDSRRRTGLLSVSDISCSPEVLSVFNMYTQGGHVYQFRHDENDVSELLLENDGDIAEIGQKMIVFFER